MIPTIYILNMLQGVCVTTVYIVTICVVMYILCSDGGGAIIEGLEVELKKIDDGNFLLLQIGDAPRELKVVTPSNILAEVSKREDVLCV